MRKFLAVLMAVFMLAATLAVLPLSAEEAATVSNKDGSTAADAEAIDLVITEVAANTKSFAPASNFGGNAFQYIEIYNRGDVPVDLYDYAIVQAEYKTSGATPWETKFTKKISIDDGSIYAAYEGDNSVKSVLDGYKTSECLNPAEAILQPGEVALIWFWNADTKAASDYKNRELGKNVDGQDFYYFRDFYKKQGAEIPADTLILAVLGTNAIATSFQLNTTDNFMYGLVKDVANNFDMEEPIYTREPALNGFTYERNEDVICLFEHGKGLGWVSPEEGKSVIYTTADNVPVYQNKYYEQTNANYVEVNNDKCEGFKELGVIWYKETTTPGKLLPIQWADLDPDRAPATLKTDANWATTVWTTYVDALLAANKGNDVASRPEENKGQSGIDVDRNNLGNLGQNTLGAWVYFYTTDESGVTTYYRYQNDGQHDESDAVKISKEEYDIAIAALAEAEEGEGLGIWLWVIIGGAAVVVLGAGAAVLIIVLKKKNKNVATDDVAGDVEIIDENGETIAVEEMAAPAQETTEE